MCHKINIYKNQQQAQNWGISYRAYMMVAETVLEPMAYSVIELKYAQVFSRVACCHYHYLQSLRSGVGNMP